MGDRADRRCGACRHFRNDPSYIEEAIPGLVTMSSGYASVRDRDGICLLHDRYLSADAACADFAPREASASLPLRRKAAKRWVFFRPSSE